MTGGSGLLEHLARRWTKQLKADGDIPESGTGGRAILLAGSCSQATLGQIEEYRRRGLPSIKLSPEKLLKEPGTPERVWNFVESQGKEPVLVYSSDRPDIRLVLKSGNFGQPDFFLRALERTEQKEEP